MALMNTAAFLLLISTFGLYHRAKSQGIPGQQVTAHSGDVLNQLMTAYDARVRPSEGADPERVQISMYVANLRVDVPRKMLQVDVHLRQAWKDMRLSYKGPVKEFKLGRGMWDKIWTPDVSLPNMETGYIPDVPSPNRMLRLQDTGDLLYSIRLLAEFRCPEIRVLETTPDSNFTCPIYVQSYGYPSEDVILEWATPVAISSSQSVSDSNNPIILGVKTDGVYKRFFTGTYVQLHAKFSFKMEQPIAKMQPMETPAQIVKAETVTAAQTEAPPAGKQTESKTSSKRSSRRRSSRRGRKASRA